MGRGAGSVKLVLVGAGGHARPVAEAAELSGYRIVAYAAPDDSAWCPAPRIDDDAAWPDEAEGCLIGLGGIDGPSLARRSALARRHAARGPAPAVCHPAAQVSGQASMDDGAVALAGAIVNGGARVGAFAIINTGAIVEHDTMIEEGAHVAPGAIVLGGAHVGAGAMIGAGAVVLPGVAVPEGALVPALSRFVSPAESRT